MRTVPLEKDFQQSIIEYAELCGWFVYHVARVKRQLRAATSVGYPDLTLLRGSQMIFAELKVGNNRLTEDQRRWMDRFNYFFHDIYLSSKAFRGGVYVWRPEDWPEIERILK